MTKGISRPENTRNYKHIPTNNDFPLGDQSEFYYFQIGSRRLIALRSENNRNEKPFPSGDFLLN